MVGAINGLENLFQSLAQCSFVHAPTIDASTPLALRNGAFTKGTSVDEKTPVCEI